MTNRNLVRQPLTKDEIELLEIRIDELYAELDQTTNEPTRQLIEKTIEETIGILERQDKILASRC